MTEHFAIAASDDAVRDVAEETLRAGHGAVAAALAGFFAAAGAHPGVLLGPIAMIVASAGACRVFDGRLRQPGLGARRPRGFTPEQEIPLAAYLAASKSALAVSVAQSYSGVASLGALVRPGIAAARRAEASQRRATLEALVGQGALAFAHPPFARALLLAGGQAAGGNLSRDDLESTPEVDRNPRRIDVEGGTRHEVPWSGEDLESPAASAASFRGLCVVDRAGSFASLAYQQIDDGIAIEPLQLLAPRAALPVRRGVSRLSPGTALSMDAVLCIHRDSASRAVRAEARASSDDGASCLAVELHPDTGRARVAHTG